MRLPALFIQTRPSYLNVYIKLLYTHSYMAHRPSSAAPSAFRGCGFSQPSPPYPYPFAVKMIPAQHPSLSAPSAEMRPPTDSVVRAQHRCALSFASVRPRSARSRFLTLVPPPTQFSTTFTPQNKTGDAHQRRRPKSLLICFVAPLLRLFPINPRHPRRHRAHQIRRHRPNSPSPPHSSPTNARRRSRKSSRHRQSPTPATSVTSIIVTSIDTMPTIGACFPRTSTFPRVPSERCTPSP